MICNISTVLPWKHYLYIYYMFCIMTPYLKKDILIKCQYFVIGSYNTTFIIYDIYLSRTNYWKLWQGLFLEMTFLTLLKFDHFAHLIWNIYGNIKENSRCCAYKQSLGLTCPCKCTATSAFCLGCYYFY